MRQPKQLTLSTALGAFVLISGLLFGTAAAHLLFERAEAFQADALRKAVEIRGRHAAQNLAQNLDETWTILHAIKSDGLVSDPAGLAAALAVIVGNGERVSWAGFAGSDGQVIVASNDMLTGADVSERPWFQRGLSGDFAGDVHKAVLLNRLLGGSEEDPLRFIDLATQVTDAEGQVTGVLGFHIDFAWAEALLAEEAEGLGLDLFLVDQAGTVIIATDETVSEAPSLQALRAAAAGVPATTTETWPDGRDYVSTVIPEVRHGDLPSFGWRMVARIDPASFDIARADLVRSIWVVLIGVGAILALMTLGFARWFLRPVGVLAENARRIAAGEDEYPLELNRTAEMATLSAALARLQSRAPEPVALRHSGRSARGR